ncbi:sugar transferase [Saccharococcus caldoxylosilyticus]|uniref:Putative glycosyltransferase n=1 Tax=Parageobacillus caldoxylosilyticus NBRC 107762 TaxID=1220594 RepID=A0A023DAF6_9BACL|nr:sugar transferase [Parageobacillus caldoxylosilyticus]MBB3851066.1 lipopolysaccharide/colanic/teichoic acid biosynthesis glycosyltransferase [Parageobacillus caldoxylosilyticus]GAJ38345.1 putative glycosyltransferase [Parageobacillus caldoxylosilyticus NBRC 107762]
MYQKFFKRLLDILFSIVALPFFLILWLLVGIAIKLDDGGPVFYCGERLGRNLKKFKMYKFRSMVVNAPDLRNEDGSTFNSSDDIRLTRVGKVIRKLSIDEVPQILNVLKGDMSFVGPRPSPCGNVHLYSKEYLKKFTVRPGITGYTQAFFRNSISVKEKQKADLYYVENISFILDLKIIFKTVFTVLQRKGLYTNEDNRMAK